MIDETPSISADLTGPRFHFTSASTWMNDPNGLIRHDGRWHLFYQNNPHGRDHDNLSWGHAVSDDLATWEQLPVAIMFTQDEMVFSGSIVHDERNVSGLAPDGGPGPLLAFYTSAYSPEHPTHPGIQAQSLAYSLDSGLTWTRYAQNPVLDRESKNFRDPKVFFHNETAAWVMVAVEALDHSVVLYTSTDLLNWEYASTFTYPAIDGGVWECPDLVRVPVVGATDTTPEEAWILILSTNPGGPAGGSGMYTLVGDFDGRNFLVTGEPQPFDLGPDCYAAVSFSGVEGEPVLVGWMNNWDYASQPQATPWHSSMTLPRRILLESTATNDLHLRHDLVAPSELAPHWIDVTAESALLATLPGDEPFRLQGTLALSKPLALLVQFGGAPDARELVIEVDEHGRVTMDRSGAHEPGFAPLRTHSLPYRPSHGTASIPFELIVDRSTVELVLDEGRAVISMQILPGSGDVTVFSELRG